ncbi:MAG: hypothetical protein P8Y01_00790 [Woeseiaceae bacterium]
MAKKKAGKTSRKRITKSESGLDADTRRQIERTIRDTLLELSAEAGGFGGGFPGSETHKIRMPQPAPCDDRFTLLVPIIAYGKTKELAEASLATRSRQESRNSAAQLQCSAKTCPTTDESCALDYGHVVLDTKEKTFTTAQGRKLTLWFCWGIHAAGCFCLL